MRDVSLTTPKQARPLLLRPRQRYTSTSLVALPGCLLLATLIATPLAAQDNSAQRDTKLNTLKISSELQTPTLGSTSEAVARSGKINVPIADTPFSISVIERNFFQDIGAKDIQDALTYSSGVYAGQFGQDTRIDSAAIRGLDATNYLDGLRSIYGSYNSVRTNLYTLESIEVLKGPSSVLYGQSDLGGIINAVSKLPQAERAGEVWLQAGSFDRKQLATDVTGSFTEDKKWRYRLVALTRNSGNQVDHVDDDGYVFMPSLTWAPTEQTSITLVFNRQENKGQVSAQFLPARGTFDPAPRGRVPTSRFVGEPDWDKYDREKTEISLMLDHQFNESWGISSVIRKTTSKTETREHWTTVGVVPDDNGNTVRTIYLSDKETDVLNIDIRLEGVFATGKVIHRFVAGLDRQDALWEEDDAFTGRGQGGFINLYDPNYGVVNTSAIQLEDRNDNEIKQFGVYLIDNMEIGPVIISSALRYDDAKNTRLAVNDDDTASTDYELSGRFGVMYQFDNGISPYVSYSEAFSPNLGTDDNGGTLDATTGDQVEMGVKYLSDDKTLSVNVAYFDIEQEQRISQGATPGGVRQTGAEVTGWELELKKRWRALELLANYTHLDAKQSDVRLPYVVEQQASVWGLYTINPHLRIGAGVRYQGDNVGFGGDPQLSSATLYDALIGYSTEHWDFSINAQNLLDKTYLSWCRGVNQGINLDCGYGDRRNILANVRYKF